MKNLLICISMLLLIAGLNSSLTAQPQYYNSISLGSGNSFPFNVATGKDVQLIFLPGEFSQPSPAPAGNIVSISFIVNSTIGPATYTTFTIQMGQSTSTFFNGTSFYTGSLTSVYNHASVTLSGATGTWMTITLDTPFPYDPTQSLIMDIGQCGATGTIGTGSMSYTFTTTNTRNWSAGGCPFAYYGANSEIYNMGISLTTSGPPVCVTIAATSITTTTASLNGTVNANGSSTTVTFDYGLTTAYGTTVAGVPATVTGNSVTSVTAAITNLTPNTLYHFRVNGTNVGGISNGMDLTFTSGIPVNITVGGTVTGTACYNVTDTITVAGNPPTFTVQSGGSVEMIAGVAILYMPGTTVQSGGYMWGHIAPTGPWCLGALAPSIVAGPVGIEEVPEQSFFKIYPNPTTGFFTLELSKVSENSLVKVEIYGMRGEKILNDQFTGEKKHKFSLESKPAGIYFIRIFCGDNLGSQKIIRQ